jgi:hypothetical protein
LRRRWTHEKGPLAYIQRPYRAQNILGMKKARAAPGAFQAIHRWQKMWSQKACSPSGTKNLLLS